MSVKEVYEGNISEGTAKFLKSGGGSIVVDSPFESGEGVDSAVLKTPTPDYEILDGDTAPDDWETDWTNYYEKVGDQYVPLSGDTAPEYVKNTYYKLIDRTNTAVGAYSVTIGSRNQANGKECLAAGGNSVAGRAADDPLGEANDCFALGYRAEATGENSFVAGGYRAKATGSNAFSSGKESVASASCAHAEGFDTLADGENSHTEGYKTSVTRGCGHAEGNQTSVSGANGHAEGKLTVALGDNSHAGGDDTTASGLDSFTHGANLNATHDYSSVFGYNNATTGVFQTVVGGWSSNPDGTGSGVEETARFAVGAGAWNRVGEVSFQTGYGDPSSTGSAAHYIKIGSTVLTEAQLIALLAKLQ